VTDKVVRSSEEEAVTASSWLFAVNLLADEDEGASLVGESPRQARGRTPASLVFSVRLHFQHTAFFFGVASDS